VPAGPPAYAQQPPAAPGPQPGYAQPPAGYQPPGAAGQPPRKGKGGLIAAIVAAVLVLGGGGFAAYWFLLRDGDEPASAGDKATVSQSASASQDGDEAEESADPGETGEGNQSGADGGEDGGDDIDDGGDTIIDPTPDDDPTGGDVATTTASPEVVIDDDFDPEPFCAVINNEEYAAMDGSDFDLMAKALEDLRDAAPAEIKGDLDVVREAFLAIATLDPNDTNDAAQMAEILAETGIEEAMQRVGVVVEELCGG
jgi:hypothetical protein